MTDHNHTHQAPDDADRLKLDDAGLAITQDVCHDCGEVSVTIAQAFPDYRLCPVYITDTGEDVEELVVGERDYSESELTEYIAKLQKALVELKSHKRLLQIAHTHKG